MDASRVSESVDESAVEYVQAQLVESLTAEEPIDSFVELESDSAADEQILPIVPPSTIHPPAPHHPRRPHHPVHHPAHKRPVHHIHRAPGGVRGCETTWPLPAQITVPAHVIALAKKHTFHAGLRGVCQPGHAMSRNDVATILRAAWTAFGAPKAKLASLVGRNLAQVLRESTYCPNILQGYIGDVNDNNPAGEFEIRQE